MPKLTFYHYGSAPTCDNLERLPLFDISFWPPKIVYDFKYRNFTGKVYINSLLELTIFRHRFSFSLTWDRDSISPDEARRRYHARLKAVKLKRSAK